MTSVGSLAGRTVLPDLRLIVITDAALAAPRSIEEVVHAALTGGARTIQLRSKEAGARELYESACALLPLARRYDALLMINDRLDVALAAGADGVHLGPGDLPVAAARRATPDGFVIGYSTDEPDVAAAAIADGADYIGCGAVFGTLSKKDIAGERLGVAGLAAMVRAVRAPVVAIGGIDTRNVAEVAATGAAGCAVIRAIMTAPDPAATCMQLIAPFTDRG
jgi:thiamine-phosphate pyrophosphorylase